MTTTQPTTLPRLKALAHETRYEILKLLGQGERCVCDLEQILRLPQSKVSYHLAVLRDAELVTSRQRGKNVYYQLRPAPLFRLSGEVLCELLPHGSADIHQTISVC